MTTLRPKRKAHFPMKLFVALLFCVPIAWIAYSIAHGHKLFQDPPPADAAQPTR